MRKARLIFAVAGLSCLWVLLAQAPAFADDCKTLVQGPRDLLSFFNIQDCIRTGGGIAQLVGTILGGTAVIIALIGLPGAGTKPPDVAGPPEKKFEPRDRDECGAELQYLSGRIDAAIVSLKALIDHRTNWRMEKLKWEIKAAELRSQVAHYRSVISQYDSAVAASGLNMLLGFGFWTPLSILLAATGTIVGIVAAWGIRGWRGYVLAEKIYNNYQGLDVGHGVRIPYSKLPRLRAIALQALAFANSAADAIDQAAKQFDDELKNRTSAVNDGRGKVDDWYQRYEETYQRCLQSGNLPPGTWHRPPPSYDIDDEGAVIGVSY
jgi:hypothetical protein